MTILEGRKRVYEVAKNLHPERWSGKIRNWNHEGTVELNPVNQNTESNEDKIAA